MTTFDEAAIARAAQVLAGRVSTGRADSAACALAVLDAAHQGLTRRWSSPCSTR